MKHVKNFKSFNERYFFGDDDKTSYQKNTNPITLELVKQKIKELLYGTKSNERYFFDDDKKGGKNVDKEINEFAEFIMTDFNNVVEDIDTNNYYEEFREILKKVNEKYFFGDDEDSEEADYFNYSMSHKNTKTITLESVKQKIKELLYGSKSNEKYFFDDDKKGGKNVDKEINELAERIMTDFHEALTIIDHIHSKQFSKIENMI